MQLVEAQIRILRSRIDSSRIVPAPEERAELLRLGARMGHDIDEVMHVVLPGTYKKWRRQLRGAKVFRSLGRPRTPLSTRLLVLRMAKENLQWGYRRVVGEIKKLGIRISPTTIRSVLKEVRSFPRTGKSDEETPDSVDDLRSRPHRGVGRDNTVLDENLVPQTEGVVRCNSELSGILKSYYREAV